MLFSTQFPLICFPTNWLPTFYIASLNHSDKNDNGMGSEKVNLVSATNGEYLLTAAGRI